MVEEAMFDHRATELVICGSPSLADWKAEGQTLLTMHLSLNWWIGDWILLGEARFGEDACLQALSDRWAPGTLLNRRYVAMQFAPPRRRGALSFSHHQDLASYPEEEQENWLDAAEAGQWTRAELRRQLKKAKGEGAEDDWLIVHDRDLVCICGRRYRFALEEE